MSTKRENICEILGIEIKIPDCPDMEDCHVELWMIVMCLGCVRSVVSWKIVVFCC